MDIDKCNIYFGNLKIKTGYFGQYKFYEDSAKRDLTLIKMGEVINNNYYIPPTISLINGGSVGLLEMGQTTNNSNYIAPIISVIDGGSVTLIQLTEV